MRAIFTKRPKKAPKSFKRKGLKVKKYTAAPKAASSSIYKRASPPPAHMASINKSEKPNMQMMISDMTVTAAFLKLSRSALNRS